MAVVDGSLVKVLLWDAVVLTPIDKALEDWEPASNVDQHVIEPQSMAKRY